MPKNNSPWKNLLACPGSENIVGTRRIAGLCDDYVKSIVKNKTTDLDPYTDLSANTINVEFSNPLTFEQFIQLLQSIVV
jgi:hypothetical protein